MSSHLKQLTFIITGMLVVGAFGYWSPGALQLLGLFAIGMMLTEIARTIFPENK